MTRSALAMVLAAALGGPSSARGQGPPAVDPPSLIGAAEIIQGFRSADITVRMNTAATVSTLIDAGHVRDILGDGRIQTSLLDLLRLETATPQPPWVDRGEAWRKYYSQIQALAAKTVPLVDMTQRRAWMSQLARASRDPEARYAAWLTQRDYASTLRSGTLQARYAGAQNVLTILPSEREDVLWLALAEELGRVRDEAHRRGEARGSGQPLEPLGAEWTQYTRNLIQAVSQWDDPRALAPLVAAAGSGQAAGRAIVRFGEMAVPPLVEAARHGHASETSGVLVTLTVLIEGLPGDLPPTPLTNASRQAILTLAREKLRPGLPSAQLIPAAGLGLATGDGALRQIVERLAHNAAAVTAFSGLSDPERVTAMQTRLRTLLDRHSS